MQLRSKQNPRFKVSLAKIAEVDIFDYSRKDILAKVDSNYSRKTPLCKTLKML